MALLTGCSSDDDGLKPANSDEHVPLRIAASINTQANGITRAFETSWEADDKIGVYVTVHNSETLYKDMNDKEGENIKYTFHDGTNYETLDEGTIFYREFIASSGKIYLSDTHVDVYGYYPYSAKKKDGTTDLAPKEIEIDVSNQTSQEAIDFMQAKKADVNNGTAAIELLFKHKLVKLVFNLKQGDDLLTDELKDVSYLGMTIGDQYTTATYDIYNDQFANISGGLTSIIPFRASSAPTGYVRTFEAIVLPNSNANAPIDRTVTITFYKKTEDQIVNTFKIPSSTRFEAGHKYIYNVTVNATSIQVNTENKYTEQW